MQLLKPPSILCVHISRVTYSPYGTEVLNSAKVSYPREFVLSQILPPKELPESNNTDSKYKLASLIEHVGITPHSGHYMAYKRLFPESLEPNAEKPHTKWLQANDEQIQIIEEEELLNRKRGAYLLFY